MNHASLLLPPLPLQMVGLYRSLAKNANVKMKRQSVITGAMLGYRWALVGDRG